MTQFDDVMQQRRWKVEESMAIIAIARELAALKMSGGQIADALAAKGYVISRSAVVARCMRAGIKLQGYTGRPPTGGWMKRRGRLLRGRRSPIAETVPAIGDRRNCFGEFHGPAFGGVSAVDLRGFPGVEGSSCRWPQGDEQDQDSFRYCGDPATRGSYCARHGAMAHVPPRAPVKPGRRP